nr:hypothetical protein RVX_0494 [Nitratidesulfovibrio sp. HK-II]
MTTRGLPVPRENLSVSFWPIMICLRVCRPACIRMSVRIAPRTMCPRNKTYCTPRSGTRPSFTIYAPGGRGQGARGQQKMRPTQEEGEARADGASPGFTTARPSPRRPLRCARPLDYLMGLPRRRAHPRPAARPTKEHVPP